MMIVCEIKLAAALKQWTMLINMVLKLNFNSCSYLNVTGMWVVLVLDYITGPTLDQGRPCIC